MRTLFTLLTAALLIAPAHTQTIQWMHDAGSTPFSANEHGTAVDADTDGNAYVLGHLAIDSQFSGLAVPAAQDGCLAKYAANGAVQWVRTFGGPGFVDIQENAVKVSTVDDAVYVCGSFRTQIAEPTVIFDTISFTFAGNSRHGFLAKYDLAGNIQWMRHGGGTGFGVGYNDLDIDDQGRIVVVGTADGTNAFDGQTLTFDGGLLLRYLPNGTLSDLIPLNSGSAVHQEAVSVEVAPGTGNIYVSGVFFDTITLNGFTASSNSFNAFLLKLDTDLTCQWLSTGGGTNSTYAYGLAIDGAENCYITGNASGLAVTFGTYGFAGNTEFDDEVFVVKYDGNGTAQWLRRGGSIRNDQALDILADAQGNTVITGYLGGNIGFADFDGIHVDIVSQSAHAFIARYAADGTITYAKRLGGGSDDTGAGLSLANDSTFYLTGTTWGSTPWLNWNFQSCCLDPNLFIAKFNDGFNGISTGMDEAHTANMQLLPNPASDHLTISGMDAGTEVAIFNAQGARVPIAPMTRMLDVSSWPNGMYFLSSSIQGASAGMAFIISH